MTIPYFGVIDPAVTYKVRHGVYAIVADQSRERIILVQAPNGAWFLPGGEIEGNEDHMTALKRELLEELGYSATISSYLGQADEYFYSSHRETHFHNPAYFYDTLNAKQVSQPLEDFNHTAWFSIDDALTALKRGSHKWGVKAWLKQRENVS